MKTRFIQMLGLAVALTGPAAWAAAPTILCSSNQTLECTSSNGAWAEVQAMVQDTDGDNLMVVFAVNGVAALTNIIDSASASNGVTLSISNLFGFGTNDVSVGVTDDGTNVVMCSTTIVVEDTTPPEIDRILATPNILWPPNHRMVPIRLRVVTHDDCGTVTWKVHAVRSNESEDEPGSGNTAPDWEIRGDHKVLVRAERSGRGNGRVYRITVEATDHAGNNAYRDVRVFVPHDRRHHAWLDDDDDDDQYNSRCDDDQGQGKAKGKAKAKGKKNGHGKK